MKAVTEERRHSGELLHRTSHLVQTPAGPGKLGISRTQLARLRARGDFPEPIRLSPGVVAWRASDVQAWIDSKAEK